MSSQLQNKFEQFEATPPKDAWLAIENRLNNTEATLQDRLYDYEATPPAAAWNVISSTLDNTSPQREPISLTKRKWFRFATATIILGIIALGVLTYATQKSESTIAHQTFSKQQQTTSENSKNTSVNMEDADNVSTETIIPIKEESISIQASPSTKSTATTITKHYKVVAKEDGQIVRLSQKAYAVFDCAVKQAAQKSADCKENIQTMQSKMATSTMSVSTDFAGLIDMIKTLEENK